MSAYKSTSLFNPEELTQLLTMGTVIVDMHRRRTMEDGKLKVVNACKCTPEQRNIKEEHVFCSFCKLPAVESNRTFNNCDFLPGFWVSVSLEPDNDDAKIVSRTITSNAGPKCVHYVISGRCDIIITNVGNIPFHAVCFGRGPTLSSRYGPQLSELHSYGGGVIEPFDFWYPCSVMLKPESGEYTWFFKHAPRDREPDVDLTLDESYLLKFCITVIPSTTQQKVLAFCMLLHTPRGPLTRKKRRDNQSTLKLDGELIRMICEYVL